MRSGGRLLVTWTRRPRADGRNGGKPIIFINFVNISKAHPVKKPHPHHWHSQCVSLSKSSPRSHYSAFVPMLTLWGINLTFLASYSPVKKRNGVLAIVMKNALSIVNMNLGITPSTHAIPSMWTWNINNHISRLTSVKFYSSCFCVSYHRCL